MELAQKFRRPIICFVDTPAAYPGIESEERGVAEAIALNLREMAMLDVPVIVVVHGEGGSGGALGIAVGDRILMHEFAIYSVIPPEGCAAILWRDAGKKVEAAEALKITAPDLLALGIIDEIVQRAGRRRAHRSGAGRGARSTSRSTRALAEVSAHGRRDAARRSATRSSARWARSGSSKVDVAVRWQSRSMQSAVRSDLEYETCTTRPRRRRCAQELGVSPVTARLLAIRGITDPDEASRFLKPSLDQLLRSVQARRTSNARSSGCCRPIAKRERIAVHGDYDVDGITSTVILRRALELLGADVVPLHSRAPDATATACSPARSIGCTPKACSWSSRSTAAFAAPKRRGARASSAST